MRLRRYGVFFLLSVAACALAAVPAGAQELAVSPLVFELNRGQAPPVVRFLARSRSLSVAVENAAFTVTTNRGEWLRFSFAGASAAASVRGEHRLPGTRNYFVGDDPALWTRDVPTFGSVRVDGLYTGIDVVFRTAAQTLEYDLLVAPGVSPDLISMTATGTMRLSEEDGALAASTAAGVVFRQLAPRCFQNGAPVRGAWRVRGNEAGFSVGPHHAGAPLIIDPVIVAATYVGGSSIDEANAMAVDRDGNIYITGATYSTNYPVVSAVQAVNATPAERDGFITKLDPSGRTVLYSTYFGGNAYDIPDAIAVDASGAAYVVGSGYSTNLPVSANAFQKKANRWVGDDGFLVKLNPAGNAIAFCTYLTANSDKPSFERLRAVAVDSAGHALVTGDTTDPTWPVTAGAFRATGCDEDQDAFVTKVSPDGSSLIYSTYLCGKGWDYGRGIGVDAAGNAYVTGTTSSADFPQTGVSPVTVREGDAWVAKLSPSGTLLRSTLVGGSKGDSGSALALGPDGSVYITGTTRSTDFPSVSGYQKSYRGATQYCQNGPPPEYCGDSYIARLSPDLLLLSATYVGGARSDDTITAIAASAAGVVVAGTTESTDFPLFSPTQATYAGSRDTFVSLFDPTLNNLLFSTFVGGDDWDVGQAVAMSAAGAIHVAGYTGSANFPTFVAMQPAMAGGFDAFVVKFSAPEPPSGRRRAARH